MANINIGGRLHSTATGNTVVGANEILDDSINKKQNEINAETYRLVENINNSLKNLSPEQIEALSVAEKANNNEIKLGYFECETERDIAAKVITNAAGYILSKGGSIKIKMINDNIASNVTLNINSTGAKTLYYNNELVSPTNTWKNNEIIEVYYDGNNYYANNIECIEKFATGEKIKEVGIDDKPTAESENLIKSGGVYTSLKGLELDINTKIAKLENAGYQFVGVATKDTNPNTPDTRVFYIADGKGVYTNFDGISVTEDDIVILYYDTAWHKVETGIASNNKLVELYIQINGKEVTENFRDGYYVNMNSATIGNTYSYDINYAGQAEGTRCYKISTTIGEKYVIKGNGISNYAGLFVLTGNENIVLQKIGTIDSRQNPVILDITENGFLYVNLVSYNAETDKVIRLDTSKTIGIAEDVKKLITQPVIEQAEVIDDGNSLLLTKKGGEFITFSPKNNIDENAIPKYYLLRKSINLFDGNYILGSMAPSTGILIDNTEVTRTYRTSDFIEVEEGASYKCSTANEFGNRTYNNVFWTCYDETKTLIAGQEDVKKNALTIPQGCKFIRISGQFVSNMNENTAEWMVYKYKNADGKFTLESIFFGLTAKSILFDHMYSPKGYIEHIPNILHMNRKTYVALGDSLCDFSVFPEYVGYLLGIDVVNGGFGGCRMSDTHPQETYKAFGLVPIVDAIVSGDWSRQEAVLTTHTGEASSSSTWVERVNKLKALDFRDVAVLSISYINNDYASSIQTSEKDSSDTSTIFGALNYAIEKLTTAFPYIQIVVISPIFRTKLNSNEINVETYRTGAGYTMPELVSKEKECCDYNHYEFLDAYHGLGINKHNSSTMLLADGTHLDYEAIRRIGRLVAGYIFTH